LSGGRRRSLARNRSCYRRAALRPVGFENGRRVAALSVRRRLLGYRLLHEYFTFPQKFLFVELSGLQQSGEGGDGSKLEIEIVLDQAPRSDYMPTVETFRLGCAPVVNLFSHTAEPIRLDQTQHEYRVIPEVRRPLASEIYSIDAVSLMSGETQTVRPVQPIYSLKHTRTDREQSAFWYQTRRPSDRKATPGTEVYVSLVDLRLEPDCARRRYAHAVYDLHQQGPNRSAAGGRCPEAILNWRRLRRWRVYERIGETNSSRSSRH
jgi:type VI secretion system protein ImpG